MTDRVLTIRELNRATLARQMLLQRESQSVSAALERLAGLQAQLAIAPYVALWTRLLDFQRDDLAQLIANHEVVKATMMRATLHLFTADDYLLLRGSLQPALDLASGSIVKNRGVEFDTDKILAAARAFIGQEPRSFAEISDMLTELEPDIDIGSMRYTVRTTLPLVQVPNDSQWSFPGNPKFALAETWLGKPIPMDNHLRELVNRYLAAFGPATIADIQKWSGLRKLKEAIAPFKPDLVTYRDERGRELLDLPDMPLPDADMPAPERLLPEFDSLILGYDDRSRAMSDDYRKIVFPTQTRILPTILVDGFVRGVWKIERKKKDATLVMETLEPLTRQNRVALTEEAERLVRFAAPEAKTFGVRFAD